MAIAFSCPQCGKGYRVKDELAGKPVACKECAAPMRVPAPVAAPAVPHHEAESVAEAALKEAPAEPDSPPDEIEFECPNCIESVKIDAKFAGKQAPCPNCRRIVRVPQPADAKARNWRAADHRPSLARHDDTALEGHWGNTTTTSVVSRDALAEADALRKRRPRPGTPKWKIGLFAGGVALAVVLGVLLLRSHRTAKQREDFLQLAFKAPDAGSSPVIESELHRAAGAFYLRHREPRLADAEREIKMARDKAPPSNPNMTDKTLERTLLLTEIALTQAALGGDAGEVANNTRLPWSKVQPELRRTLNVLNSGIQFPDGGVTLAYERLARALGMSGEKEPIAPALIAIVFEKPEDRAEPLAIIGLEFARLGSEGKERAVALAAQIRSLLGGAAVPAKVIALHLALDQIGQLPAVKPPGDGEPPLDVRLGFAEGYAWRGEMEAAHRVARLPGRFEDRFAAAARIANVVELAAANPELAYAVDLLIQGLGARDLPDWPLIRLAQACNRAGSPSAAGLFDFLQKLPSLSPRSQAVRAWVQFELIRGGSGVPLTEATVQAMTPAHAAGVALAWEALGRQRGAAGDVPASTDAAPEWMRTRALALAGVALGLLEGAR